MDAIVDNTAILTPNIRQHLYEGIYAAQQTVIPYNIALQQGTATTAKPFNRKLLDQTAAFVGACDGALTFIQGGSSAVPEEFSAATLRDSHRGILMNPASQTLEVNNQSLHVALEPYNQLITQYCANATAAQQQNQTLGAHLQNTYGGQGQTANLMTIAGQQQTALMPAAGS